MKLLITGGNGYIGKYLVKYYTEYGHQVLAPSSSELDLTDRGSTERYMAAHSVDCVINAAFYGREMIHDPDDNFYIINFAMFVNLLNQSQYYKKFIHLGSGYEYDNERNIDFADEDDIQYVEPKLPYASLKHKQAMNLLERDNCYNIRLFGLTHYSEPSSRFFQRLLNEDKVVISEDCKHDFFNLEDVPTVIDLVLNNQIKHKAINCVYENKYTLSQQARIFCEIKGLDYSKVVVEGSSSRGYTGSNLRIKEYNLPLLGLELAFLRY
jgi:nucleoside-diphosphate-sugar epimerase